MRKRNGRSELSKVVLPIETCLSLVAAAIEVYPKECMGCLITRRPPKKHQREATVTSIFSYQLAKRSKNAVESFSHWTFEKLLKQQAHWAILGDFHSHPYPEKEGDTPTEPSRFDLENVQLGRTEIIIKIVKVSKKVKGFRLKHKADGTLDMHLGYYSCNVLAFTKERGKVKVGRHWEPKYRRINIKAIK